MDILNYAIQIKEYCNSQITCENCVFAYWHQGLHCMLTTDYIIPGDWELDKTDEFDEEDN